jgi:pantoate--beta-alanine ligase
VPGFAAMQVHETKASFRAALDDTRRAGGTVGLVPTMGYLHDGHVSLARRSVAERGTTGLTIFVNPLQFGAGEDLASYPRDLDRDLALCRAAGVDHVLAPSVEEVYPRPVLTSIHVGELGDAMEGAARPGHFDGMATVVAKLFAIAGPCAAYFGEKDYQQLAIVRRMASDLDLPVDVVGCPIVREPDGLAMSSRNVYLEPAERAAAPVLHQALQAGAAAIGAGERDPARVRALVASIIEAEPLAELDYAEVVESDTLRVPERLGGGPGRGAGAGGDDDEAVEVRLLVAARLGRPRLLDNLGVRVPRR